MAKAPSIEDQLAQLAAIGKSPDTTETRAQLRKNLGSKSSVIVAKTADIIAGIENHEFASDLMTAFQRFMREPAKTDKGCAAKTAIVKALLATDCDDEQVFRTGVRHVQLEPVWGGRADTAAPLRALCALGLVQTGSPDAMIELATLLADPEPDARIGAAHALAHCGHIAVPLLRFKVLSGDSELSVLSECLNGLVKIAPAASLEFVGGFIDPASPLYESAAFALAESRIPEVFALLHEKWTGTFDREFKQILLLPIALTRSDAACDFLISLLETGDVAISTAVIKALSIYRGDAMIRKRAEEAICGQAEAQLRSLLRREFD